MGKTRDLKKIRDTKGTFHAKMCSIKDRNGMDLTEAEPHGCLRECWVPHHASTQDQASRGLSLHLRGSTSPGPLYKGSGGPAFGLCPELSCRGDCAARGYREGSRRLRLTGGHCPSRVLSTCFQRVPGEQKRSPSRGLTPQLGRFKD